MGAVNCDALDAAIYQRFRDLLPDLLKIGWRDPEYAPTIKRALLDGASDIPPIAYRELDEDGLLDRIMKTEDALREIVNEHPWERTAAEELYRDKLEQAIAAFDMVRAYRARNYEGVLAANEEIYGLPSTAMLKTVVARLEQTIELTQELPGIEDDRAELRVLLDTAKAKVGVSEPIPELLSRYCIGAPHRREGPAQHGFVLLKAHDVINAVKPTLWQIEQVSSTGMTARTSTRRLEIPNQDAWLQRSTPLDRRLVEAKMSHEKEHIEQATRALKGPLHLLESGLAGPGVFAVEEMLPTLGEKQALGAHDLPGYAHALAIALCLGSFGTEKLAFMGLYEVLKKALLLEQLAELVALKKIVNAETIED